MTLEIGVVSFFAAGAMSAGLLLLLRPLLARYALVKPNIRSSHTIPTPQGAGVAVIAATLLVASAVIIFLPLQSDDFPRLSMIAAATVGLAVVGMVDDLRPIEAIPRLILQIAAVATVISTLPAEMRVLPGLPWWLDRGVILVGGVWLVNVVNFMDGLDWMTVAEIVPLSAGLAVFGLLGALPDAATFVALALCGAIVGFAPFNKPVAKLFLGDVGSLPLGLLVGWLLALLAGGGHLAAALLLPLYYLADATLTLLRRLAKGEKITQAHRTHFYQRARDRGYSVYRIVGSVFAANVALVALALVTVLKDSAVADVLALTAGCVLVGALLLNFRPRRPSPTG